MHLDWVYFHLPVLRRKQKSGRTECLSVVQKRENGNKNKDINQVAVDETSLALLHRTRFSNALTSG
jgi:hypothetical protein